MKLAPLKKDQLLAKAFKLSSASGVLIDKLSF